MALFIDRSNIGRTYGVIAGDLSDKMDAIGRLQQMSEQDAAFNIAKMRLWFDEYTGHIAGFAERSGLDLGGVDREDRWFAGPTGPVRVRVYNPRAEDAALVFVHGGGWVIGSLETHDHIARWIAKRAGCQVISVDYSLAPEHPYPAAVGECAAVIAAVAAQRVDARILVAGDSAGANVAAMAILALAPAERRRLSGFVSIYGAYAPGIDLSSHKLYGDGRFGLSADQMRWFWNLYAPQVGAAERAAKLSPLDAPLQDFPPTLCIGAECDVLLDDTLAFYGELAKASVEVTLSLWSALPHGCLHFVGVVDSVTQAANSIVQFIKAHAAQPAAAEPDDSGVLVAFAPVARTVPAGASAIAGAIEELADSDDDAAAMAPSGRGRMHGAIAQKLATDIITGVLPPHSLLLTEDKSSELFNVSRSAYREAIRTLSAKGLVSALPKVGTKVAPRSSWRILDPDVLAWFFEAGANERFIRNLFELRKIVEPSAATLAAVRRTDAQLSKLADALARMAGLSPSTDGWLDAMAAFHRVLLVASQNEAILSLWPAVETTLRWSVKQQTMRPMLELGHDPVADHARVFEKIASKNADGALQEMAFLIESALSDTLANTRGAADLLSAGGEALRR